MFLRAGMFVQISFDHALQRWIDAAFYRVGNGRGHKGVADVDADRASARIAIGICGAYKEDILSRGIKVDLFSIDLQLTCAEIPDLDVFAEVMIALA